MSAVKNYLEKALPVSNAISGRRWRLHLPSICSAVNSICQEKRTEPGMRAVLLPGVTKGLSPAFAPRPPQPHSLLEARGRVHAVSGRAVPRSAPALAAELRSLRRAQPAAARRARAGQTAGMLGPRPGLSRVERMLFQGL